MFSLSNLPTVSSDHSLPVYSVPCSDRGTGLVHRLEPLQVTFICTSLAQLSKPTGQQNKKVSLRRALTSTTMSLSSKRMSSISFYICRGYLSSLVHKLKHLILSVGLVNKTYEQSQTRLDLQAYVPV